MAKQRTATEQENLIMGTFRTCVEKYAAMANYVRSVNFSEQTNKSSMRLVAMLDCGLFKQRIVYYPDYFLEENFIDVEFSFGDSAYPYTFYDVFNLFDIDDFNLYYYKDCSIAVDIDNAVKTIFNATEKHLYYLEKAGDDYNLPQLIKNYETDMDTVYRSTDWREEEPDIDDVPMNHPLMSFADGEINEKMLKRLRKKNEKGKLDTLYEKRLLKHLEQGGTTERKDGMKKSEYQKMYFKKSTLVDSIVFICSFVVMFGALCAFHYAVFKEVALSFDIIILSVFGAVALLFLVLVLFGKKLIVKFMPDEMKEFAAAEYNKNLAEEYGKFKTIARIAAVIALLFLMAFLFISAIDDVAFYDNHIRYSYALRDDVVCIKDVSYEELTIYKVAGYYDDDEYVENENAYALSDGKGGYYDCGELAAGGDTEQTLFAIAEKYNKSIAEIASVEEIVNVERK